MGITPEFCSFCMQACTVCLEKFQHQSGVEANIMEISEENKVQIHWTPSLVQQQAKRSWGDAQEATEYGATAFAFLLTEKYSGFSCLERSSKGGGFDYWLGDEDDIGIFQRKAKLEISGILEENPRNKIEKRVNDKFRQTQQSAYLNMNAHVCIAEFSNPKLAYKMI